MEFCRRWGIVPWVEAAGYNRDYRQDNAWVTSLANGYELGASRSHRRGRRNHRRRARKNGSGARRISSTRCWRGSPHVSPCDAALPHGAREFYRTARRRDGAGDRHATGASETIAADYLIGMRRRRRPLPRAARHCARRQSGADLHTNVIFRCGGLEKLHT